MELQVAKPTLLGWHLFARALLWIFGRSAAIKGPSMAPWQSHSTQVVFHVKQWISQRFWEAQAIFKLAPSVFLSVRQWMSWSRSVGAEAMCQKVSQARHTSTWPEKRWDLCSTQLCKESKAFFQMTQFWCAFKMSKLQGSIGQLLSMISPQEGMILWCLELWVAESLPTRQRPLRLKDFQLIVRNCVGCGKVKFNAISSGGHSQRVAQAATARLSF